MQDPSELGGRYCYLRRRLIVYVGVELSHDIATVGNVFLYSADWPAVTEMPLDAFVRYIALGETVVVMVVFMSKCRYRHGARNSSVYFDRQQPAGLAKVVVVLERCRIAIFREEELPVERLSPYSHVVCFESAARIPLLETEIDGLAGLPAPFSVESFMKTVKEPLPFGMILVRLSLRISSTAITAARGFSTVPSSS
jgi:hypothetical protein